MEEEDRALEEVGSVLQLRPGNCEEGKSVGWKKWVGTRC